MYAETVNRIDKIIDNYESFKSELNNLIVNLESLSSETNNINYRSIEHQSTINLLGTGIKTINEDIDKIANLCTSTLQIAKAKADSLIKDIVDQYNNSILDNEEEPKLSYRTVSSASIGSGMIGINYVGSTNTYANIDTLLNGSKYDNIETIENIPLADSFDEIDNDISEQSTSNDDTITTNEVDTDNSVETNNETYTDDINYDNYDHSSYQDEVIMVNGTLTYYLSHATDILNSSSIPDWNQYITKFLKLNKIDNYVKNISIIDGKVVCVLTNGTKFNYDKVDSVDDLLKKLKDSISMMNGGGTNE